MTIEQTILDFLKDKKAFYTVNEIIEWISYHDMNIKASSIRPTISQLYLKGKLRRETITGANGYKYGAII